MHAHPPPSPRPIGEQSPRYFTRSVIKFPWNVKRSKTAGGVTYCAGPPGTGRNYRHSAGLYRLKPCNQKTFRKSAHRWAPHTRYVRPPTVAEYVTEFNEFKTPPNGDGRKILNFISALYNKLRVSSFVVGGNKRKRWGRREEWGRFFFGGNLVDGANPKRYRIIILLG